VVYIKGTQAEVQVSLNMFPDSSVSSLILVGVRKDIPPPKTYSNIPRDTEASEG
jgi:hypothetical protein